MPPGRNFRLWSKARMVGGGCPCSTARSLSCFRFKRGSRVEASQVGLPAPLRFTRRNDKMNAPEIQPPLHHQIVTNRFVAACQADERVVAAFLGGSYAR